MFRTCVLALLTLFVGLAHSFSWEIVEGQYDQLNFYKYGTIKHTEIIPFAGGIVAVTYDPVHNRVFFVDLLVDSREPVGRDFWSSTEIFKIYSFDITTKKTKAIVSDLESVTFLAYDPATESLFWNEAYGLSNNTFFSLKLESNQADRRNKLFVANNVHDIAVDICGGYVYWLTDEEIERVRFDGSEREVFIDFNSTDQSRISLAIDHQTQKIYWTEYVEDWMKRADRGQEILQMKSVDLNGTNIRTLHNKKYTSFIQALTISKDFIYWKDYMTVDMDFMGIWQLPKDPWSIVNVEPRQYLEFGPHRSEYRNFAANYTIVCSLNKEDDQADYEGERGDISICKNYCLQGNCSVGTEGQPTCRCDAGFSGERCEVDACQKHCLNNGICSINDEEEPVCQCTSDYEGERCDVQSQSKNETVGQSFAQSQPDLSKICDDDSSIKVTDRTLKETDCLDVLAAFNDFRAEMNVILFDLKNSTNTLLAEHNTMKEYISQQQQECTNTVILGPVTVPED